MPQSARVTPAKVELDQQPVADSQLHFAASVVVGAVAVAAIYFGRPILVPLALAVLLAFALAPIVSFLRQLHAGRVVSVFLASLLALAIIAVLVAFIGTQLAHLAADLPRYQHNITSKVHTLVSSAVSNTFIGRTSTLLNNLGDQVSSTPSPGRVAARGIVRALTPSGSSVPVPVEIRQPAATPIQIIENIFRPLLEPLATAGIAIIFVVFILLQKEDLRDRFIWMAGSGDLQRAKIALDDGASRLSRYLLTQTGINTVFGTLIGAGLWLIGVPHPWLWGLVSGTFRFIPYVGVPLAAIMPLVLSLAVDPGWAMMFWTAGLYLVLELVTSQLVEPFLYGHTAGLSPVAVVVAATFWTWVWGPVGLLLSTPLTLCLAVMGRHVERLRFLDVLLGDRPPLAEEESVYLRMLAGDPDDAARLAETFLKEHSLCEFSDTALSALVLAQADLDRGALDQERSGGVKQTIEGLLENLSESLDSVVGGRVVTEEHQVFTPDTLPTGWSGKPVVCVAGRGNLDEAAALLLVHLLENHGIGARILSSDEVSTAKISEVDPAGIRFICLSYLQPGSGTNAHYLMRRLRRRVPDAHTITGFWGLADDNTRVLDAMGETEGDVVTNFDEALARVSAAMKAETEGGSAGRSTHGEHKPTTAQVI